jgi:hypothetical protein
MVMTQSQVAHNANKLMLYKLLAMNRFVGKFLHAVSLLTKVIGEHVAITIDQWRKYHNGHNILAVSFGFSHRVDRDYYAGVVIYAN